MKTLKVILGVLFSLAVTFVLVGMFAPAGHRGKITKTYDHSPQEVWNVLTDIEGMANRRGDIASIEMNGPGSNGYVSWREHMQMGGYIDFEIVDSIPLHLLEVQIIEGSYAMEGKWLYQLEGLPGNKTEVTIMEESQVESFFMRTLMFFAGRDKFIKQEHKYLRKALE